MTELFSGAVRAEVYTWKIMKVHEKTSKRLKKMAKDIEKAIQDGMEPLIRQFMVGPDVQHCP